MTARTTQLWRVVIQVAPHGRKRLGLAYHHALAPDAAAANALALADWGYRHRAEKVLAVFAVPAGRVVQSDVYRTRTLAEEPGTIPPGLAIDAAGRLLQADAEREREERARTTTTTTTTERSTR